MIELRGKKLLPALQERIQSLLAERKPTFLLIYGKEDASVTYYIRSIQKALDRFGIPYENLPVGERDTKAALAALAEKRADHQVVLARPIADERLFLSLLEKDHDPDMASTENLGRLFAGDESFLPATCKSVQEIVDGYGIPLDGRKVLILGRSRTVGLPLVAFFEQRDALVSLAHSHVPLERIRKEARESDVVVLATGKKGLLRPEDLQPGAVVLDCGFQGGAGDLGFVPEEGTVSAYTPVPGGIGILTSYNVVLNGILLERHFHKNK